MERPPLSGAQSTPRSDLFCNVDPDKVSAVQPYDDQRIKQVEANGRDNEQVHGGNILGMITQKDAPRLAWRPAPLDHVFGDTRLRDLKTELEQLAVDAWCSPKWVIECSSAG